MYCVANYNYDKKSSEIVYEDTERNCLAFIEATMYDIIVSFNGFKNNIDFDEYIYEKDTEPNLRRYHTKPSTYITKSNKINCWKIKTKTKVYGYVYNTYINKNIVTFYCIKRGDFLYEENRSRGQLYTNYDNYGDVLIELCLCDKFREEMKETEGNDKVEERNYLTSSSSESYFTHESEEIEYDSDSEKDINCCSNINDDKTIPKNIFY